MTDPHQNGRNNSNNPKRFWRRSTWFVGVALISFFLVGAHFPKTPTQTAHKSQITKLELPPLEIKPAQTPEVEPQPELEKEVFRLIKGDVARNQSLSHLMGDHGIPLETVLELVKQSRPTYNLNRLRPGQPYSIKLTSDDQLVSF